MILKLPTVTATLSFAESMIESATPGELLLCNPGRRESLMENFSFQWTSRPPARRAPRRVLPSIAVPSNQRAALCRQVARARWSQARVDPPGRQHLRPHKTIDHRPTRAIQPREAEAAPTGPPVLRPLASDGTLGAG